ncbi:MAG: hypothetical protein ACE367_06580 [Acidimicrobiales bacterium]
MSDPPPDSDEQAPRRIPRPRRLHLVAAAIAIVAVAVVVVLARSGGDGDAAVTDTFEGTGFLGDDSSDVAWEVLAGAFIRSDGAVRVAAGDDPASAVVEVGFGDGELVVPVIRPADGAGVIFRVVDEDNHWRLTYSTEFATWNIDQVTDGAVLFVANTGLSGAESAELGVSLDGDDIVVAVDGERRAVISDESHQDATAAGLFVADTAGAERARMLYEAFEFTPAS